MKKLILLALLLVFGAFNGATMNQATEPEFYPMPLFVKLSVPDVATSAKWYQSALGFRCVYALPGADGRQEMNHLRLGRYQDLMLVADTNPSSSHEGQRGWGVMIYFTVDKGTDSLARQAAAAGAKVKGPTNTPWNTREVSVNDPNGYVLTFSEVLDPNKDFSHVMPGEGSQR